MRTLSLAILLAACSSSSTSTPNVDATAETISMSCGTAVTDYCATHPCDKTQAAAEKDADLCPASQMTCGSFNVVLQSGAIPTSFYYQNGDLVAIAHPILPNRDCLAGPATFDAPRCVTAGRTLPSCATSDPPPSGW